MDKTEVAAELGMGVDEVIDVVDTADGVVAHLVDDTKMIRTGDGWMFLVAPNDHYEGTFPVYPGGDAIAKDLEADGDLDDLEDLETRTGSPEAFREGETDKFATTGELEATTAALVTEPGPPAEGAMTEPDGPAGTVASAANAETGAHNVADAGDPADPGTSVPEGPAHLVLAWVGNDPTRARQALGAEQVKDKPRSSLVRDLEAIAGEATRATES